MEKLKTPPRKVALYKMWKQSLYKWDSYVKNRHLSVKLCDHWSKFIVESLNGRSIVFNSGGLFFRDFVPDITVVEYSPCPVLSLSNVLFLTDGVRFEREFDNLIVINPISLKYNHSIYDFLAREGISRMGYKPNLLNWLKSSGKIYLSVSDWHIYYDRLRFSVHDMVAAQLKELHHYGIKCQHLEIIDTNLDVENGNIKLVLST